MNFYDHFLSCSWDEADENLIKIPVTWMDPSEESAQLWNAAYFDTLDYCDIIPTPSGGISKQGFNFRYYSKLLDLTSSSMNLYIVKPDNCYVLRFRDSYRVNEGDDESLSGCVAASKFRRMVKKNGFDIWELSIDNGKEVKETISKPDIRMMEDFKDRIVPHAFHVDINSAYFAGIEKHFGHCGDGALGKTIRYIYDHRNDGTQSSRYYKFLLNGTQGYWQSRYCIINHKGYALSHLSKAGISDCKERLNGIIDLYCGLGCRLVATNTDGAWFAPPPGKETDFEYLSHVPGYGRGLGEFKIDHFDCQLRYRSRGAYEYIEKGVYKPVIRGRTVLDYTRPRTSWMWGDIYHKEAMVIKYGFSPNEGIGLSIGGGKYGKTKS